MGKMDKLAFTEFVAWITAVAAALALVLALAGLTGPAAATQVVQPQAGNAGNGTPAGQTHADHGTDHTQRSLSGKADVTVFGMK
jgi:cytochrome oxidase Cu insertion factor (SCO1/SenC/PrrC family)